MFEKFSQEKAHYKKGQIFPFIIALICIVLILILITINLGQIGIMKTDVSNAADAGALAAASVISGTLLSYGLTSDLMCGFGFICIVGAVLVIELLPFPADMFTFIAIIVAFSVGQIMDWLKAYYDGQMAWTNAKKTAVSYAFQNLGVDEPRPTFEQFLTCAYGVGAEATPARHEEYIRGESDASRLCARSGFAMFMEDGKKGYWDEAHFGKVDPRHFSNPVIVSGYGWEQDPQGTFYSSYCNNAIGFCHQKPGAGSSYRQYAQYVEVEVRAASVYTTLDLFQLPGQQTFAAIVASAVAVGRFIYYLVEFAWLGPLAPLVAGLLAAVMWGIVYLLISGLSLGLTMNHEREVDNNNITVIVKRYKRPANVGLWRFRYGMPGNEIRAVSVSHAFRQNGSTIEPVMLHDWNSLWALLISTVNLGAGILWIITHRGDIFDTEKHLFETEIREVH